MSQRGRGHLIAILAGGACVCSPAVAQDSPDVQHQAAPCTIPDRPIRICAAIQDDGEVVRAAVYFRAEGREYFNMVEMKVRDDRYCATLPAPRAGKLEAVEYYVQAIDDEYLPQRTVPFLLELQEPEVCGFPPVETDPSEASSITVFATNRRQDDELDDRFSSAGVRFVPRR